MRITAHGGSVSVNGAQVAHVVSWDMSVDAELRTHRGASETATHTYVLEQRRAGAFAAEADPDDTTQAAIISGASSATLTLTETSGVSYTFTAVLMPAIQVDRRGKVLRLWRFTT